MTSWRRSVNLSVMKPLSSLLHDSVALSFELLRRRAVPLLVLMFLNVAFIFPIEDMAFSVGRSNEEMFMILHLTLATWGVLESVLIFLLFCYTIPEVRVLQAPMFLAEPFKEKYFASLAAESLRAMGFVLLWCLALILPGIYKYCRYIFVPFISIFSKEYRDNKADALKLSEELSAQPALVPIIVFFIATNVLSAGLEVAPHMKGAGGVLELLSTISLRIVFLILSTVLSTWSFSFLYVMFEARMRERG